MEWILDERGVILEENFHRSVIRSCVKLAYEHAQDMLDNPEKVREIFSAQGWCMLHCTGWFRINTPSSEITRQTVILLHFGGFSLHVLNPIKLGALILDHPVQIGVFYVLYFQDWSPDELPPISPPWTASEVSLRVNLLQKIALRLRKRREDNGALRLDQPKVVFALDKETGMPSVRDCVLPWQM